MTDTRHRTTAGTWFRFVARMVGILGVGVAAVGGVMWRVEAGGTSQSHLGFALLAAGGVAVGLWLLVELIGAVGKAAGAKSAQGGFTTLLGVLAVAAVVVVNLVSARFYARIDATRDARFTLDRKLVDDLKTLDPSARTTVVVLQLDKTSAYDPDLPDAITSAAQTKITEKVLDLIDDLRQHPELSARFDVQVLSRKDEKFQQQLDAAAKDRPNLKAAVEGATESSVFFAANGRVRRMPFAQFYLLDKTASRGKANVGAEATTPANLVLAPQGKERFVRALVGLERKAPKVGLLTIHPLLTTRPLTDDNGAAFTAAGLRGALERNGCEVVDVVLKKGWDGGTGLSPSADTLDESKLDEVTAKYIAATESLLEAEDGLKEMEAVRKFVKTAPIVDVKRQFRDVAPQGNLTDDDYRAKLQTRLIDPQAAQMKSDADDARKRAAKLEPQFHALLDDDKVQADRRAADVKAKLTAAVADCDLLILPRLTAMSLANAARIPARLYEMKAAQAAVVKEFLTAGKPVLFAFGPLVGERVATDDAEKVVERLGIELGTQTVLTTVEAEAMREPDALGGRSVALPPLELADPANPVAAAFDRANRTVDGTLDIKRSGYRPLYLTPRDKPFSFSPAVLHTTADAWNESRPLPVAARNTPGQPPTRAYFPKVDTVRPDDPKSGTREQEKKQRFVVGVAAELPVPAEWTDPKGTAVQLAVAAALAGPADIGFGPGVSEAVLTPDRFLPAKDSKTVRVAVFGHGGLFVGKQLDPGQEALLNSTANWLMARDDSLPKDVPDADKWRFPRVPLTDREKAYWQGGAVIGLPLAAALLGLVAVLLRKLR